MAAALGGWAAADGMLSQLVENAGYRKRGKREGEKKRDKLQVLPHYFNVYFHFQVGLSSSTVYFKGMVQTLNTPREANQQLSKPPPLPIL